MYKLGRRNECKKTHQLKYLRMMIGPLINKNLDGCGFRKLNGKIVHRMMWYKIEEPSNEPESRDHEAAAAVMASTF